jgi:twitching motility protein PilU
MDIVPYLKLMADKGASDLFFCTGTEPQLKIEGVIRPVGSQKMAPSDVKELAYTIMSSEQAIYFEDNLEMNFAIPLKNVGRFRVNIFL